MVGLHGIGWLTKFFYFTVPVNLFRYRLRQWFSPFLYGCCPLCQRPAAEVFCRDCAQQLVTEKHPDYQFADLATTQLPLFSWGLYDGALRRAIAQLKYAQQSEIGQIFGTWLAEAWLAQPQRPKRVQVVPVPLHASRQQQRGYNQAALMAQRFCQLTGDRFCPQGLTRIKATQAQFSLSRQDRQANLVNAFAIGCGLDFNRPILILDDIYTTGATLQAAIAPLLQAQYTIAGVVVMARTR
jgi:ComF family protein